MKNKILSFPFISFSMVYVLLIAWSEHALFYSKTFYKTEWANVMRLTPKIMSTYILISILFFILATVIVLMKRRYDIFSKSCYFISAGSLIVGFIYVVFYLSIIYKDYFKPKDMCFVVIKKIFFELTGVYYIFPIALLTFIGFFFIVNKKKTVVPEIVSSN